MMIEFWVEKLRRKLSGLTERGAAKQLYQTITIINGVTPLSNMPTDSGDLFSKIWYDAWAPAILTGAAISAECSHFAHNNRNVVMSESEILNPLGVKLRLRQDFTNWKDELIKRKPKAFQDWSNLCQKINVSGFNKTKSCMIIGFDFSDLYCVPDFEDDDEEDVFEDQVWQHDSCKDVKVQILKVDNGDVDVIVVGRLSEAEHNWFLGKQCSFDKSDFVKNWSLYKDIGDGAICKKCKQNYPFAMKSKYFVCYSCKNGWS